MYAPFEHQGGTDMPKNGAYAPPVEFEHMLAFPLAGARGHTFLA
jgi:hypothetical protein